MALQYRLGYYGFLSSKELQDEARANGEVGFANVGLHDQRLGLQWVSKDHGYSNREAVRLTFSRFNKTSTFLEEMLPQSLSPENLQVHGQLLRTCAPPIQASRGHLSSLMRPYLS